jgi:hypothetical protein
MTALISPPANSPKIDNQTTDGLLGVSNSLAYRLHELERHIHNEETWWGRNAGGTDLAVQNDLTSWQLTAGTSEAFGAWVQLTDGTQFTEGVRFDAHRIMITAVSETDDLYYIQLGTGEAGAQVVKTTAPFYAASNFSNAGPIDIVKNRELNTVKLWARCKCQADSGTINFVLGIHSYEG